MAIGSISPPREPEVQPLSPEQLFPSTARAGVGNPASTDPLRGEKNQHFVPRDNIKRPPGDVRSAEQIINDNPILKDLDTQKGIRRDLVYKIGDQTFVIKPQQEKNIYIEMAYEKLGDWSAKNPDPESRADAAYNAARVLNWIDSSLTATGQSRGNAANNGVLEGFTSSGYALDGTPARLWQEFAEEGYGALPLNQRLAQREEGPLTEGPHPSWSDRNLIGKVEKYFREFAAGADDEYVNFHELHEAAGLVPSTRTFSAEAQEVALELLARPELLLNLDIGIYDGRPGRKDGRFDMDNIVYIYNRASNLSPLYGATSVS